MLQKLNLEILFMDEDFSDDKLVEKINDILKGITSTKPIALVGSSLVDANEEEEEAYQGALEHLAILKRRESIAMNSCANCGKEGVTTTWEQHDMLIGGQHLTSSIVPERHCPHCGLNYTDEVASDIKTFDQFREEQAQGIQRRHFAPLELELWERALR